MLLHTIKLWRLSPLARTLVLPAFRPFADRSSPVLREVGDVFKYAKTNRATLTPKEVYHLFNTLFSLKHYSELRKMEDVKLFFSDPQLRKFMEVLEPRQAVKIAKRLSQLEIAAGSEWDPLLRRLEGRLSLLSDDDLYSLMLYAADYMVREPLKEIWSELFVVIASKADTYRAEEVVKILQKAAEMRIESEEFWTKIEGAINAKAGEMRKEHAEAVIECYRECERSPESVMPALRKAVFSKFA